MPAVSFHSTNPATGQKLGQYRAAAPDEVDSACLVAQEAFEWLSSRPNRARAVLLEAIAERIAALGDRLLEVASAETGLAVPRLASERDRTAFTLRMFAGLVRDGGWVRAYVDPGDPARKPLPKPDLRRMLRPLGPVGVFGASNFPLAYSTAGGDTASALAAGCPVVVKGHPSHPGTGEMVAAAVRDAVAATDFHHGTFAYLPAGGERELAIGQELVTHPAIAGVGFTGSFGGGTALAQLAAGRAVPIPVYAEMGSINPIFVLREALERDPAGAAEKVFASVANSAGQMCTCPGLIMVPQCPAAQQFCDVLVARVGASRPQAMLSDRIRRGFLSRVHDVGEVPGVEMLARSQGPGGEGEFQAMVVFRATAQALLAYSTLRDECFGPSTIVVTCPALDDMLLIAARTPGSLAGAIFADAGDFAFAGRLASVLAGRVGRLVWNGVTTGVEVSSAMVHGGPWPATNQPHTTAVGAMAIERWCRPVCFQNAPTELLPEELR